MDFLLDCIGFPPNHPLEELVGLLEERGEPIPWRGSGGDHRRVALAGGLEVRGERHGGTWSLWPFYRVDHRLRVALIESRPVPDSPFDRLVAGIANPGLPRTAGVGYGGEVPALLPDLEQEEFPLCAYLEDARRLPRNLVAGHVLALGVTGFALDVGYVGPNDGGGRPGILERARGALFEPLVGPDDPGGCMAVSLRVRSLRHVRNPLTGIEVEIVEADAPGRPMPLFLSRWQLEDQGLALPRPGWRIEGIFVFQARIAGGLPRRGGGGTFG